MKKLLSLILLAGMFTFYACGPGNEEKAEQEKAAQETDAAVKDSMMREAEKAAMETAKMDSMSNADSTHMPADSAKQP